MTPQDKERIYAEVFRIIRYQTDIGYDDRHEEVIVGQDKAASAILSLIEREQQPLKEIAQGLADWSRKYPRGRIYSASNMSMDDELIALEEKAKEILPTTPNPQSDETGR
jgi:hypothetical protein